MTADAGVAGRPVAVTVAGRCEVLDALFGAGSRGCRLAMVLWWTSMARGRVREARGPDETDADPDGVM